MIMRPISIQTGKDSDTISLLLQVHCAAVDPRILDVTHNVGVMWEGTGYYPLRMDKAIKHRPQVVARFQALPFAADSFDVVAFDLPHLPEAAASAGSSGMWADRYGIVADGERVGVNISALFAPFLREAARVLVPNGIILAKVADLTHDHAYQWQQVDFINAVRATPGLTPCDQAVNLPPGGGNLQSSQWERIFHLRKAHSYWIVVRKGGCECPSNAMPHHIRNRATQLAMALEARP